MERQRRYPSDLTDAQWEIVEPMLPLIKSPGRIPKHPRRAIVDAILYVVRSGCSWRQLPVDFPPWQTVYWQFQQWEKRQVTERILEELREQVRLQEGRAAEPSAGIIDSQSVKGAATSGVSDSIQPSRPNLAAAYAEVNSPPTMPAVDEIDTTSPDRWARITGRTARVTFRGPNRFV